MTATNSVYSNQAQFARDRAHLLQRIEQTPIGEHPFHHIFIEQIFPDELYCALRAHMLSLKHSDQVIDRHQDNPAFVNRRCNLFASTEEIIGSVRALFSDAEVKRAILNKFYLNPTEDLVSSLSIHEEFEFVFTAAGRFQNIHVDIPPKYVSLVFYLPEHAVSPPEEQQNATILYDAALQPHYAAKYRANSVCMFVPHFSSYHGFSTTIDRDVLVMFYVHERALESWRDIRAKTQESPPFTHLLDAIEHKLRTNPLRAFGDDPARLAAERRACLVNAPQGRVLTNR